MKIFTRRPFYMVENSPLGELQVVRHLILQCHIGKFSFATSFPSVKMPAQRWLRRYVHSCYKRTMYLYIVLTPEDLENMGCHVAKFSSPLCIQHHSAHCRWCRATGGDGYYQPLNTPKQWPKSLEELEARQWSRQQTGENG